MDSAFQTWIFKEQFSRDDIENMAGVERVEEKLKRKEFRAGLKREKTLAWTLNEQCQNTQKG
jgi:hypothetical protein